MGTPISTTAKEDERLCSSMNPEGSLEGELGGVWGTLPWAASNAPKPCRQQQAPTIPRSLVSRMPKCEQGWLKPFEVDQNFGQEVYLLKTTPPINKDTCFEIETFTGFSPGKGPLQLNQRWKGGNINLRADSLLTKF